MAIRWKSKTPWREKLRRGEAKLVDTPLKWQKRYGEGKMLVPCPMDVDRTIRRVRKGRLATQSQVRDRLARDAGADATCPLTAGILLRIAAEAAEEDRADGKARLTPWWRIVRDDGGLNPKMPGGVRAQARHLRDEGHVISPARGKKPPRVRDLEGKLARI